MSERKLIVRTAQGWFDSAQDSSNTMAERLLFMENALNHTENALVTARQETSDLHTKLKAAEEDKKRYWDAIHRQYQRNIGVIGKMEKAEQERDNLQQQVSTLHGVLKEIQKILPRVVIRDAYGQDVQQIHKIIDKTLSASGDNRCAGLTLIEAIQEEMERHRNALVDIAGVLGECEK